MDKIYDKIHPVMITADERSDLIHIMKMNRFSLVDADSAQLRFSCEIKQNVFEITILAVEDLPSVVIKRDEARIHGETVKSIDDMKIFLEEKLYKHLEV